MTKATSGSLRGVEDLGGSDVARNLVYAGLFLLGLELIGDLMVRRVRFFYDRVTHGLGMPFTTYEQDVLSRNKDVFKASVLWLRDHLEAISSEQAMDILAVRTRRNALAHELAAEIVALDPAFNEDLLVRARNALFALSNFWVRIEIGVDPEFQDIGIEWDEVHGEDLSLLDAVIRKTHEMRLPDRRV